MTLGQQIIWGGFFLVLCMILHIACLMLAFSILRALNQRLKTASLTVEVGSMMVVALIFLLAAHTAQIAIWSQVWLSNGTISDLNDAVYFSLVTYTTVGYGDVTLGPEMRIFGTFTAMTGVMAFGISTAFLVALMSRTIQTRLDVPGTD